MTNEEMREASGNFKTEDTLIHFLYLLMRDKVPCGTVEELVMDVEEAYNKGPVKFLTNGWLALYAENLANRLTK
jgi:hypothetical protein